MSHLVLHILPSHSLNLELLLFSVFIFIGDDSSDRTASKSLVFLSFFFSLAQPGTLLLSVIKNKAMN